MLSTSNTSNVLLPKWILRQESTLSEHDFLNIVNAYLSRYEGYRLIEVKNSFAVCDRTDDVNEGRKSRG